MAALIAGFRKHDQPEPGPGLLANVAANLRVPWWRRGGMGIFEYGAILTEFVPAILLLYWLFYQGATAAKATAGACLAVAAIREGVLTGDGSVVASILVPLYHLTLLLGLTHFERPLLVLCVSMLVLVVKLSVCMTTILHRWAAHAAFKCSYPMSVVLVLLGCLATQGGPIWWASKHRCHHKFCDTLRDPHSPKIRGLIGAFAWFGKEHKYIDLEFYPPHLRGALLMLIDTYAFVPTLIEFCLAYRAVGLVGFYVAYVSGGFCKAGTLWFNVSNHPPAQLANTLGCLSADMGPSRQKLVTPNVFFTFIMAITTPLTTLIGEATHHHHHQYADLAHRPGGVDLPYYLFILPLEALGLVWEVKHLRPEHDTPKRM
mmetsp:Transcript_67766/g.112663  ORF Transcript_67766/g.112663 Transcript_67766/m.112663 type:complete len:373 (-) Transcript_67766:192-1310(-)